MPSTLPKWSAAAAKILLLQPSSTATECVFSLLKTSFGERTNKYYDYICVTQQFGIYLGVYTQIYQE